jgi:hypothetical protein
MNATEEERREVLEKLSKYAFLAQQTSDARKIHFNKHHSN